MKTNKLLRDSWRAETLEAPFPETLKGNAMTERVGLLIDDLDEALAELKILTAERDAAQAEVAAVRGMLHEANALAREGRKG